eukprot:2115740-Rhodomonas_salina.1
MSFVLHQSRWAKKSRKGEREGKKGQAAKLALKVPVMLIEGTGLALPSAASFGAALSQSLLQQKGNSLTLSEELGLTLVLQNQVDLSSQVSLLFSYSSYLVVQISNPAVPSTLYLKSMVESCVPEWHVCSYAKTLCTSLLQLPSSSTKLKILFPQAPSVSIHTLPSPCPPPLFPSTPVWMKQGVGGLSWAEVFPAKLATT